MSTCVINEKNSENKNTRHTFFYNCQKKLVLIIPIFIVFGISEFTFGQNGGTNNYLDRHGLFLLPGRMFHLFVKF